MALQCTTSCQHVPVADHLVLPCTGRGSPSRTQTTLEMMLLKEGGIGKGKLTSKAPDYLPSVALQEACMSQAPPFLTHEHDAVQPDIMQALAERPEEADGLIHCKSPPQSCWLIRLSL